VAGAEKRTHLHFTRSGSVQGRAPSSRLQRTRVRGRGRRDTDTLIAAETSRDRFSRVGATRAWRGRPAMEGIPDRVAGGSSRTASMSWSRRPRRNRASCKRGEGHGEATGVSEARLHREYAEENAAHQPDATRRSGSDVLNRQVPQSPSSGVQAQGEGARRKLRRDAGNECGASARSRKQWEAEVGRMHRARAPRTVARQAAGGRVSPSQTARSADTEGRRSSPNRMSCEGRWSCVPQGAWLSPQRSWAKTRHPSETVRRRQART